MQWCESSRGLTFVSLRLLQIFQESQQGVMLALPQAQLQPAIQLASKNPHSSMMCCIYMHSWLGALRVKRRSCLHHVVEGKGDRLQGTSALSAASRAFFCL